MSTSSRGSRILGVGGYRPARVVENAEVAATVGRSADWIHRRTGIVRRRYATGEETVPEMAVRAAGNALGAAAVPPDAVDLVLLASMSYLRQTPPAAPEVAHRLGAHRAAALDIDAACAGFTYGVGLADASVRSGAARHVLVIGADRMSDIVDPQDVSAALFGDGAGAVVVGPDRRMGIGPTVWGADGGRRGLIEHPATWLDYRDKPDLPWPAMRMSGREVFRWAIDVLPGLGRRAMAAAGITVPQLAAFVPHQANLRIIELVAQRLGLSPGTAVARDIVEAGNTSAASIPLALDRLRELGTPPAGGWALLAGFGAGLAHASQIVRLP